MFKSSNPKRGWLLFMVLDLAGLGEKGGATVLIFPCFFLSVILMCDITGETCVCMFLGCSSSFLLLYFFLPPPTFPLFVFPSPLSHSIHLDTSSISHFEDSIPRLMKVS